MKHKETAWEMWRRLYKKYSLRFVAVSRKVLLEYVEHLLTAYLKLHETEAIKIMKRVEKEIKEIKE